MTLDVRLLLALPFAVVACEGSGAGGGSGPSLPGASGTVSEFCTSFVQAAVSFASRCYGGGDEAFWREIYADVFDCDALTKSVSAGTVVYDAGQGRLCLETIRSYSCSDTGDVTACDTAVVGTVPPGGTCSGRISTPFHECAPGSDCTYRFDACTGTCEAEASVGEPCGYAAGGDAYVDCANGSSCDYETDRCVADAAEGEPCLGSRGTWCADGLYCDGDTTTAAGVCRARKTSGACSDSSECANTYLCVSSGGAGACQKAKLPGEACRPGECITYFAYCGADGKCTDARGAEGQPCGAANGEYLACQASLYCDLSDPDGELGTCKRMLAAGADCSSDSQCTGHGYCDSTSNVCVACR